MSDTTIDKVKATQAPSGSKGQKYLAGGDRLAMRMWDWDGTPDKERGLHSHPYETIGYVLDGTATLKMDGQTITLDKDDSWVVPANAQHEYLIDGPFKAIEVTSPPARDDQ